MINLFSISFNSFNYPPTIYKYDLATGKSEVFNQQQVKFNPQDYEVKQVFYTSRDGTKVPMFIVYRKGLVLNGKNPTFLTAYGGFNISLLPGFNPSIVPILEMEESLLNPISGAAENMVRTGTGPACCRINKMSLMIL